MVRVAVLWTIKNKKALAESGSGMGRFLNPFIYFLGPQQSNSPRGQQTSAGTSSNQTSTTSPQAGTNKSTETSSSGAGTQSGSENNQKWMEKTAKL